MRKSWVPVSLYLSPVMTFGNFFHLHEWSWPIPSNFHAGQKKETRQWRAHNLNIPQTVNIRSTDILLARTWSHSHALVQRKLRKMASSLVISCPDIIQEVLLWKGRRRMDNRRQLISSECSDDIFLSSNGLVVHMSEFQQMRRDGILLGLLEKVSYFPYRHSCFFGILPCCV
jgi:hypothetical protein